MLPMPEDHTRAHRPPPPLSGWAVAIALAALLALAYFVTR